MYHGRLSFVALLLSVLTVLNGQSCLRTNQIDGALPPLQEFDLNFDVIRHQHQAIIPSYRFNCHGNITEWGVEVYPAFNGDQGKYNLDLQVWRPSPIVQTTGCYSMVGNNRFTSVLLSRGVARVTPLPQNGIWFQPGDVLGFYVESTRERNAATRGVVTLKDLFVRGDRKFQTEEVWHANIAHYTPNPACPYYAVGSHGALNTFTNAAPVISISTVPIEIEVEPTSSLTFITTTNNQLSSTPAAAMLTDSLWPTPAQAASTNLVPRSAGIITGAVLASLFVIAAGVAVIVIIAVIIHRKPSRRYLSRDDSMIGNSAYGTTFANMAATSRKGDTYDYPRFGLRLLKSIRGKKDSGIHNVKVAAEENASGNTYTMNISSQTNEAYGASLSSTEEDFEYSYVRYL